MSKYVGWRTEQVAVARSRCVELWNQGLDISQIRKRTGLTLAQVNSALAEIDRSASGYRRNSFPGVDGGRAKHTPAHYILHTEPN